MRPIRTLPMLLLAALVAAVCFPTLLASFSSAEAQDERALVVLEEDEPQATYPFLARTMSESRLAELLFTRFFTADVVRFGRRRCGSVAV